MGEKRPYKLRKPGGGRKKLKPEFDAGKNLKEQMERAVALYEEECSLQDMHFRCEIQVSDHFTSTHLGTCFNRHPKSF